MNKEITLTHLNIRQSISILLAKLIFIDILAAVIVTAVYFGIVTGGNWLNYNEANTILFLSTFLGTGLLKIIADAAIILLWLNEYYEITPDYIIHKKGIIFRKTEQYRISNVRMMDVADTFFGELLNYGTVTLFDIRLEKYLDMFMIHNPDRYAKVLKQLRPEIEMKEDRMRMRKEKEL
ncbi:MAG: PH domain-containing protein [Candidatus Levyibacteriota bacterium]